MYAAGLALWTVALVKQHKENKDNLLAVKPRNVLELGATSTHLLPSFVHSNRPENLLACGVVPEAD
jgi:hypothetical protein